jgi:hypothetical protein
MYSADLDEVVRGLFALADVVEHGLHFAGSVGVAGAVSC